MVDVLVNTANSVLTACTRYADEKSKLKGVNHFIIFKRKIQDPFSRLEINLTLSNKIFIVAHNSSANSLLTLADEMVEILVKLFLKAVNTHGESLSESRIGDFQIASNIEAGRHTYIQEFWFSQSFDAVNVIIGLQDFNVKFAVNEFSGVLINSSYGLHSTIASNIPIPMFPLTSIGIAGIWSISDCFRVLSAVFDGNPTDFENNPYNLHWHLSANDGVITALEVQYSAEIIKKYSGTLKVGLYYHNRLTVLNEETYEYNTLYENNNGLYATVDQMILKGEEESSIAFFLRGSVSPKKYNNNFSFYGGGICCHSLLSFDTDGILALGFLHASLQREDNETVVELTYKTPVTKNIFLQPDIQYIINPAGTHRELQNCLVGTIRYGIAF